MMTLLFFLLLCIVSLTDCQFEIDFGQNRFLMNKKPFQILSGGIHYFRIPRQYWRDRMRKMKAAGLNTISTYVVWGEHEREMGNYNFFGDLNIKEFVQTAQEEGLFVLLRVGPYIDGDVTMGGHPYWLLRESPKIKLRSNDPTYQFFVQRWLDVLLPILVPMLFGNGGPIIALQVENGYGNVACDGAYMSWLTDMFRKHVGGDAVLYTSDQSSIDMLRCGKTRDAYASISLVYGNNVNQAYTDYKTVEPRGPFFVSHFYIGRNTFWGGRWPANTAAQGRFIVKSLNEVLALNGSIDMYVFAGGSNFGFSAGAQPSPYRASVTSYDFSAALSEAGDFTPKYFVIRNFLLAASLTNTTLPENSPKGDYGTVNLRKVAKLPSQGVKTLFGRETPITLPRSFEDISQDHGYVLYESSSRYTANNMTVKMNQRDIATIFINDNFAGKLTRDQDTSVVMDIAGGDIFRIIVENGGRLSFSNIEGLSDRKGLSFVYFDLGSYVVSLTDWTMTAFNFDDIYGKLQLCSNPQLCCTCATGFTMYAGRFATDTLTNIGYDGRQLLADSFLNVAGLSKGLVFVNDINLGRYWSTRGPQYSLYVPGAYLRKFPEVNTIVIIDEEIDQNRLSVPFSTFPIFGDPK